MFTRFNYWYGLMHIVSLFTHQLYQLLNRRILENIPQGKLMLQLLMNFCYQSRRT